VIYEQHLLDLENELKAETSIKYILFPDQSKKWRIQAVPINVKSFLCRKPLPEPWRGLRSEELSRLTDIPNCIFVHASGFIGGNDTFEGVLAMAKRSLLFESGTLSTTSTTINSNK